MRASKHHPRVILRMQICQQWARTDFVQRTRSLNDGSFTECQSESCTYRWLNSAACRMNHVHRAPLSRTDRLCDSYIQRQRNGCTAIDFGHPWTADKRLAPTAARLALTLVTTGVLDWKGP
jgi:hypothetical protein